MLPTQRQRAVPVPLLASGRGPVQTKENSKSSQGIMDATQDGENLYTSPTPRVRISLYNAGRPGSKQIPDKLAIREGF